MSRDLPIRAIAYKMQERAHGRLPQYVKRKFRTLAGQLETRGGGRFKPGIMLKPVAKPVRERGGRPHDIVVFDDGFDYEGRRYPSLSANAREESLDEGDVSLFMPLAFLAPDIVEAILDGGQPLELTAEQLKRLRFLPHSWEEQRQVLGFSA